MFFFLNIAWILKVCTFPKDFGLHLKNIKKIILFFFNTRNYEHIRKICS